MEVIVLTSLTGFARKNGTDENGNEWIQFYVDYLAGEEAGECSICGAELDAGWMCLDDGDEVCDSHIRYAYVVLPE